MSKLKIIIIACLLLFTFLMYSNFVEKEPLENSYDATQDSYVEEEQLGHGYAKKGGHIIFNGQRIDRAGSQDIDKFSKTVRRPLTLAQNVDVNSFKALSSSYTKDKNKVYYRWVSPGRFWVVELPNANPATFEVLGFELARDDRQMWSYGSPISGDVATAEIVLDNSGTPNTFRVWKDKDRVYYNGIMVMQNADPNTFRHLDQGYYRDDKNVYWSNELLNGADPETFKTYGDVPYAADKNHVWRGSKIIKNADAPSFVFLHNGVYKDKNGVFTLRDSVFNADIPTFKKIMSLKDGGSISNDGALFEDTLRYYVYISSSDDIYALEPTANSIFISKLIWLNEPHTNVPIHGATISAVLNGNALSDVKLTLQHQYKDSQQFEFWKRKIISSKPGFIEASSYINNK